MRFLSIISTLAIFLLGLQSCKKELPTPPEEQPKLRTVIAYLAANNSLINEAYENINQMEAAIGNVDGDLIVYARLQGTNPALYRITPDQTPDIRSQKIKEYAPHNSSDPTVMKQVIADIQAAYPAQTYGLILWSHATGWIPPNHGGVKVKSFGDDNGSTMDIKHLKQALPDNLDFIMFDACSMASVEVLYEIKEKAKYFISSPGEVISNGMPYNKITNDLFHISPESYQMIAQKYYEHYNSKSGLFRSATISIIDGLQLATLATTSQQLLKAYSSPFPNLQRNNIQRMDFDRIGNPLIAFDFEDFLFQNFGPVITQPISQQLARTVIFKANTPSFNGYEIKKNGGLTCYIPHPDNEGPLHDYYRTLQWYSASGFDRLF